MTGAVSRLIANTRLPSVMAPAVRWSGILALNYHRIGDGSGSMFDRGLWSCTADAFLEQLRFCKAAFDIIQPMQLPEVIARARGRYLLITFDDGYLDNYDVAFPILASEGVPATFFVTTGFIDSAQIAWWDEIAWMVRTSHRALLALPAWLTAPVHLRREREGAIRALLRVHKALPSSHTAAFLNDIARETGSGRYDALEGDRCWMTWDMLRQMRASGMTIGGHTVNHPVLARAPREVQLEEIRTCGERLASELGDTMRYFSYPVGGSGAFGAVTRDCLRQVGVQYAFSYYSGYRRFEHWDDYDIRRVPVESCLSRDSFRSTLALPQLFA